MKTAIGAFVLGLGLLAVVASGVFIGEVTSRYFFPLQLNGTLTFIPPQQPQMQIPPPLMRQPPWDPTHNYQEGAKL